MSLVVSACASAPYEPGSISSVSFRERAQTQSELDITVSATVPGPEETEALFNLPLYDRGIQPVWLEVRNDSAELIRYAPVGTDPEYFSGQEVAYVHRSGFSGEGMEALNQHFYDVTMPRRIPAGETRSGFVFTHAHPGTKGFNVDLFGPARDSDLSFTFFIEVPGFEPDHSEAFYEALYPADQIQDLNREALRAVLADKLNAESSLNKGIPVNGIVVGEAQEVLQALIRAGWHERRRTDPKFTADISTFDGRIADVVFVKNERTGGGRNELRFWKGPFLESGVPVWMFQTVHYIGVGGGVLDPDLDNAATFFLQDIWYGQGLARFAWLRTRVSSSLENPARTSSDVEYFTSGAVLVTWLSGDLVSMLEVDLLAWDPSPSANL
jgi:hypothetical protein